jgi:hypothetical protein
LLAGAAGDLVPDVNWPLVGSLEPARVVILGAGCLVLASLSLIAVRTGHAIESHAT